MALRPLFDKAMESLKRHRALSRIASLGPALDACARLQAREASPEAAAKVAWVLTDEIDTVPADKRPLLVVFIDTFERVQSGDAVAAETMINRLVAHLPYALFVITGRNSVDWYKPSRTNLFAAGARRWPSLVPGRGEEPHQHLVGRLSSADALLLFRLRRAGGGWPMDEVLLPALVDRTAGLPLHMDAVCKHADNLTSDGAHQITADDVVRDLGDLVRRLVEDLNEEQSRAFHATCLLPYFDVPLAAAVGEISGAAVEACTSRALIEDNASSLYPFRVHDRIRELVRGAGSDVKGGWADADWRDAALRGYAEARRRHDEAAAAGDDRATMEAIGLGLTLAVEYGLPADWLLRAVDEGPTIRGLNALAPAIPPGAVNDGAALVRLIRSLKTMDLSALQQLHSLRDGESCVSEAAGRFLAYRLRLQHRREEAIEVLREHKARFPDRARVADGQIAVTLRQLRRFRDAEAYRAEHGLEATSKVLQRLHGIDTVDLAERLADARKASSRRYGFEKYTGAYSFEARYRPVPNDIIRQMIERAVTVGALEREADALVIRAYQHLHDEERFESFVARLAAIGRRQTPFGRASVTRLLAMRARATGSAEYADRAAAEAAMAPPFRTAGWIFTDFAMQLIGRPLPDMPTQWLEPVDIVRARYFALIDGIIERARNGQIVVP